MENEKRKGRAAREDGRQPRTVASQKYNEKAYDRVNITMKKGNKEVVKARASEKGMSINGYLNNLIKTDIPTFETLDG